MQENGATRPLQSGRVDVHLSGRELKTSAMFASVCHLSTVVLGGKVAQTNGAHKRERERERARARKPPFPVYTQTVKV